MGQREGGNEGGERGRNEGGGEKEGREEGSLLPREFNPLKTKPLFTRTHTCSHLLHPQTECVPCGEGQEGEYHDWGWVWDGFLGAIRDVTFSLAGL